MLHYCSYTILLYFSFTVLSHQLIAVSSTSSPSKTQERLVYEDNFSERLLKEDVGNNHETRCSRERSRAAWKIVEEYLTPFVEKQTYKISTRCRLHPDNDLYRDQEVHKMHMDLNDWQCDVCGALHCDFVMNSASKKSKCNPAAASRNKHLCESLADSCFPVNGDLQQAIFTNSSCANFVIRTAALEALKPFCRGRLKRTSMFYIFMSILTVTLVVPFYTYVYVFQRGMKKGSQILKRVSQSGKKKNPT